MNDADQLRIEIEKLTLEDKKIVIEFSKLTSECKKIVIAKMLKAKEKGSLY